VNYVYLPTLVVMADQTLVDVVDHEEQLHLVTQLKTNYPLCIVVYYDDKYILVVPTGWINYYPEGHKSDPLHEKKLWCWFPVNAQNPKNYVKLLPEITESVLRKYKGVGFREFPLRRMPMEHECASGKYTYHSAGEVIKQSYSSSGNPPSTSCNSI
jgi:hypothetical protein